MHFSLSPGPDMVRPESRAERVGRRLLDFCVALFLLGLSAPVLLWAAAAVKLSTPGPVFYRQPRVGRGGRIFEIWKLRTMFAGAQNRCLCPNRCLCQNGPLVTAQDDTRVTPFGRSLRSWKLDELPQLVNVLRGEMSLIGPRPQVPRFVECFDPEMRRLVLSVRPGISGPTALYFRHEEFLLAGQPDRERFYVTQILPLKLRMDVRYVLTRSLRNDLRSLADTLHLVFSRLVGRAGHSGIPAISDLAALDMAQRAAQDAAAHAAAESPRIARSKIA